ncbi:MAG: tetratricopeptide repeat protein [Chloroflexota bacterium]|nr:tetratricopeptide repeat protein [Chloroflexota bacterium]
MIPDSAPDDQRQTLADELRQGTLPLLLKLPTSLASLPWELLCDPQAPNDTGFITRRRPLARLLTGGTQLPSIAPPLKVLLLISSPSEIEEHRRVDVESERAAVEEATRPLREAGLLHLMIEDIVTPQRVQQALMRFRPHVLHYIGHGGYAEGLGGFLEWEDERGKPLLHADAKIADLLRPRGLRAVVLHGCDTAAADTHTDFTGVAGALLGAGVPAVIAQQAKFTYESSQRASRTFYEAFTSGLGLAETLFETRLALHQSDRLDWAVPILQSTLGGLSPLLDLDAFPAAPDPALTQQAIAGNLPAPTRDQVFVGRQRELRALRQMLDRPPGSGPVLALITGPGGIGKSTLAARAIERYGGRYKAVLTLSCRDYAGIDLFLKTIGELLTGQGAPEYLAKDLPDPQLSLETKVRRAVMALNVAGPFLVVIDNVESVQGEDRHVNDPDLLLLLQVLLFDLRGGRVLVTGRYAIEALLPDNKFQANVVRLDLDDLSNYEIRQLLARHQTLAGLSDVVVDELVMEFGGLPIVYDILSSEAASQDLEGIIFDIQQRKTQERQQRTAEEWKRVRRRVVEFAALEATVNRLPAKSRDLLSQLTVFRRSFPLPAIEQGLGATRDDWQALIAWALLRYDPQDGDYQLHSLTADYAAPLLTVEQRKATQRKVAEWYLQRTNESHELADALEAHALFIAAGEVQRAGKLANNLGEHLKRLGLYQIWSNLCRKTVQTNTGQVAAAAQLDLGTIAYLHGQYKEARRLLGESLSIVERLGDQHGRAAVLHQLGMIAQDQGQYEEARQLYDEVLPIFEQLGDQQGYAATLHQFGIMAQEQGQYEEARRLFGESLSIEERLGDQHGRALTLNQLGTIAYLQGQYEEARRLLGESLSIKERLGDQHGRASALHGFGVLAYLQRQYEEARQLYGESLSIFERLGDQDGCASILQGLGIIAQEQGQYEEARRLYDEVLPIFERLGNQNGCASTLGQLGIMAQEQGQYEEAWRLFGEVLPIFDQLGNQGGRATVFHQLGSIAYLQGQYEEAWQLYGESLSIKEQIGDENGRALTLHGLGLMARQQGQYEEALLYMLEAFTIFDKLHSPHLELARSKLGEIRTEMGEAAFDKFYQELFSANSPLPPARGDVDEALLQRIITFIQAHRLEELQRMVESQAELLSSDADALLEQLAAAQQDEGARKTIEQHRVLLSRCREIGIAAAFAELPDWQAQQSDDTSVQQLNIGVTQLARCTVHSSYEPSESQRTRLYQLPGSHTQSV